MSTGTIGRCQKCGQRGYIMPLHGEKGGPLYCPFCIGNWHGEYGKKMKWRRVLMKAMAAYEDAGGRLYKNLATMRGALATRSLGFDLNLPGFSTDHIPHEFPDLTSELLADTLQLVHPDHQPQERRELAKRVTSELLALKPYVFPAPKQEQPPVYKARDASSKKHRAEKSEPSKPAYPCELCEDTVPLNYCNACRAEWEKRQAEEREREDKKRLEHNKRQREQYHYKAHWRLQRRGVTHCSNCGVEFRAKRQDAKYCSAKCRQKAYLARDGKQSNAKPLDRTEIGRAIEAVFAVEPDWAFTADELCKQALAVARPERKHRTAVLAACKQAGLGTLVSETRGGTRVVFNLGSLTSYAVARKRSRMWSLHDKPEHIKARLAPGGDDHHLIAEGGWWVRHWQMFVAEAKGNTDTPHYRKLEEEERAVGDGAMTEHLTDTGGSGASTEPRRCPVAGERHPPGIQAHRTVGQKLEVAKTRLLAWCRILDVVAEQRQALEHRIWREDPDDTLLGADCQTWCELGRALADFLKSRRRPA